MMATQVSNQPCCNGPAESKLLQSECAHSSHTGELAEKPNDDSPTETKSCDDNGASDELADDDSQDVNPGKTKIFSALQLPSNLPRPPEIIVPDGGIVKFIIKEGDGQSHQMWEKGTNAQFHFRAFTIALPWSTPASQEPKKLKAKKSQGPTGNKPKDTLDAKKNRSSSSSKTGKKPSPADVMQKIGEMMRQRHSHGNGCGHDHSGHGHSHGNHSHHNDHPVDKKSDEPKKMEPSRTLVADSRFTDPSKPFELRIGRSFSVQAFETAVKTMRIGEVARFFCAPNYVDGFAQLEAILRRERLRKLEPDNPAYQPGHRCAASAAAEASQFPDLVAISGLPLELEFELVAVLKPGEFEPQLWEMTTRDKWNAVPKVKDQGAKYVAEQKYELAIERYARALALLEAILSSSDLLRFERETKSQSGGKGLWDLDDEERRGEAWSIDPAEVKAIARACRLNYALCKLKTADYKPVIDQCGLVLSEDPQNVKALFRRAQAHLRLGRDLEAAQADLRAVVQIDAGGNEANASPEIKKELAELDRRWKMANEKEKKMFSGMFDR